MDHFPPAGVTLFTGEYTTSADAPEDLIRAQLKQSVIEQMGAELGPTLDIKTKAMPDGSTRYRATVHVITEDKMRWCMKIEKGVMEAKAGND